MFRLVYRDRGVLRASLVAALFALCLVSTVEAWTRGNHATTWGQGQTIKVCVADPPGENDEMFLNAVDEAIREWNEAQAAHNGLTLEAGRSGLRHSNQLGCGTRQVGAPACRAPIPVTVQVVSDAGLNERGLTRVLKHELGHAEGLGHSEDSDIMDDNAFENDDDSAPDLEDLNDTDTDLEAPNADDIAGKRELYGSRSR